MLLVSVPDDGRAALDGVQIGGLLIVVVGESLLLELITVITNLVVHVRLELFGRKGFDSFHVESFERLQNVLTLQET